MFRDNLRPFWMILQTWAHERMLTEVCRPVMIWVSSAGMERHQGPHRLRAVPGRGLQMDLLLMQG